VTAAPASGPLRAVLDALADGAPSLAEVARRTGLDRGLVDIAVDRLRARGLVDAQVLAVGCPTGGCGTCASGVDGAAGCGAAVPGSGRTGPVLVALTVRRRN
jgi:hypothetical protein